MNPNWGGGRQGAGEVVAQQWQREGRQASKQLYSSARERGVPHCRPASSGWANSPAGSGCSPATKEPHTHLLLARDDHSLPALSTLRDIYLVPTAPAAVHAGAAAQRLPGLPALRRLGAAAASGWRSVRAAGRASFGGGYGDCAWRRRLHSCARRSRGVEQAAALHPASQRRHLGARPARPVPVRQHSMRTC